MVWLRKNGGEAKQMKDKIHPRFNRSGIIFNHLSLIKYGRGIELRLSNSSRLNCGNESILRNAVTNVVIRGLEL